MPYLSITLPKWWNSLTPNQRVRVLAENKLFSPATRWDFLAKEVQGDLFSLAEAGRLRGFNTGEEVI